MHDLAITYVLIFSETENYGGNVGVSGQNPKIDLSAKVGKTSKFQPDKDETPTTIPPHMWKQKVRFILRYMTIFLKGQPNVFEGILKGRKIVESK